MTEKCPRQILGWVYIAFNDSYSAYRFLSIQFQLSITNKVMIKKS